MANLRLVFPRPNGRQQVFGFDSLESRQALGRYYADLRSTNYHVRFFKIGNKAYGIEANGPPGVAGAATVRRIEGVIGEDFESYHKAVVAHTVSGPTATVEKDVCLYIETPAANAGCDKFNGDREKLMTALAEAKDAMGALVQLANGPEQARDIPALMNKLASDITKAHIAFAAMDHLAQPVLELVKRWKSTCGVNELDAFNMFFTGFSGAAEKQDVENQDPDMQD